VSHTTFELRDTQQNTILAPVDIDTVVSYTFTLNGVPVEGPGARIVLNFTADGNIAFVHYAWRKVANGENVDVIPKSVVMQQVAERLGTTLDASGLPIGFDIGLLCATPDRSRAEALSLLPGEGLSG